MGQGRWLLLLVLSAGVVEAAPGPPAPPAVKDRKQLRAQAKSYARQMCLLLDQIATHYIRPIAREELLETALRGLYQAARKAPPRDLQAQVREAVSLSSTLRAQTGPQPKVVPVSAQASTDPVERLLVRLREELGDAEGLIGQNPVIVSCQAISRLLDAHSGLVTAQEQRRNIGLDQQSVGVGMTFKDALTPGSWIVEAVHPGGPAQRAGMRPGDVITHLEGQPITRAPATHQEALRNTQIVVDIPLLASPHAPNRPQELPAVLQIRYRRGEEKETRSATLLRESYRAETVLGTRRNEDNRWDWILDEKAKLGYLRIASLGRGTSEELREALMSLRERKARGILVDLRWCPGGYLNEAVELADLFLGNGVIATIKNRGREDTVYRGADQGTFADLTLVVLVNQETSGGAELIAAALQDHKRGTIVGQRTLGKASVQTPLSLGIEGMGFKLTSGTFVRPSGKNLHRFSESMPEDDWGVVPDEDARLSPDLGKRLKEWWQLQALRPPRSRERLPLDDIRADPQLQIAAGVLRNKMK